MQTYNDKPSEAETSAFPDVEVFHYYIRSVYGTDLMYPANPASRLICDIAGTKTLSPYTIATLEAYGITTQEVLKPRS